jgi:hypothetical protein
VALLEVQLPETSILATDWLALLLALMLSTDDPGWAAAGCGCGSGARAAARRRSALLTLLR